LVIISFTTASTTSFIKEKTSIMYQPYGPYAYGAHWQTHHARDDEMRHHDPWKVMQEQETTWTVHKMNSARQKMEQAQREFRAYEKEVVSSGDRVALEVAGRIYRPSSIGRPMDRLALSNGGCRGCTARDDSIAELKAKSTQLSDKNAELHQEIAKLHAEVETHKINARFTPPYGY
jgi:hypothetical protein